MKNRVYIANIKSVFPQSYSSNQAVDLLYPAHKASKKLNQYAKKVAKFIGIEERFSVLDEKRFPAINMAREVISLGGTAGAIFNAANEVAVEAFLNGRISFGQIYTLVEKVLSLSKIESASTIDSIKDSDILARKLASEHIQTLQSTIESSL